MAAAVVALVSTMSFIPYLHFQGQCAEAMTFYASVFGGSDLQAMSYSEAPDGGIEGSQRIMHSQFTADDGAVFMASDFPDGMDGDPQAGVSIMHRVADVETARRRFDALAAEGGAVITPFGPSFFARGFGMVRDRFGTHWIVASELS